MAKGLSRRGYAKHRGVSEAAVRQALKGHRITLRTDGTIDPRAADRQWERNTDPTKPRNSVTGDPKHRKDSPDAPPTPMGNGNGKGPGESTGGYAKARGYREVYAARLAKLDYEERSGSMLPRAAVERAGFLAGQAVRDAILAMNARVAPIVARLTDTRACRETLDKESRAIIQDLEKRLASAARPEKPAERGRRK